MYRLKRIIPKLNISTLVEYFKFFKTSGAIYPGVPHFSKSNFDFVKYSLNPKSANNNSLESIVFNNIFSGLISLWAIFYIFKIK